MARATSTSLESRTLWIIRVAMLVVLSQDGQLTATYAAQVPTATDLVASASSYVVELVESFVDVVAEERSVQQSVVATTESFGARERRRSQTLLSDFLLVREPGTNAYMTFRDVLEVDGTPVPNREASVTELFGAPILDAVARAREIEAHGAQYNLPDIGSLNNPFMVVSFLQPNYVSRFRWTLGGRDEAVGPDVWMVGFEERERPTILRALPGEGLPARGVVWIALATGSVRQTEVMFNAENTRHEIVVRFRDDEQFGLAVPVEMEERHVVGLRQVTATTTYGRFRRFRVQTDEEIPALLEP